jgi:phage major head subunit gpT-like protein
MTPPAAPRELVFLVPLSLEAAAPDGQGPRARRFHMDAYSGGPMAVAGWRFPIVVDLNGLSVRGGAKVYLEHDRAARVGHIEGVQIEGGTLRVSGLVSSTSQAAREVVADADNGYPWQASIGAQVQEAEFVREGQTVTVNGREFAGPLNVARRAALTEVSFVGSGADDQTRARIAANAARETPVMDGIESTKTVADAGAEGADGAELKAPGAAVAGPAASGAAAATPAVQGAAVTGPAGQGEAQRSPDPVADMRARAAAEEDRIAAVRGVCGAVHPEIAARAIREGWDVTRTELEVLRADRPKAPAAHVPDNTLSGTVLEAACVLTAKLSGVEKTYDERALDAAARRFRGGIGLQELLLEAAWAHGYAGRNFRDSRAVLRAAFGKDLQAGFSTIDVGGILSNVANKFLLEGFFSVERVWHSICAVRNVSDFKTVTSYRLVGKDQYEPVAPGGELKHGTLGEESYTNRADTFGLLLAIDRRDMINDDLGAVTTVPRKLGRGSGLAINDVFWKTFLANSAFFKTANKNYVEGADTALTIDGLTKAEKTFMDQVDSSGKPTGVMPAILLAPTALSAMATQLFKSVEIRDTTASTKYPVANPPQGKFRTEVSQYLANARYAGASDKAWYLLSDPRDLPVIEVAFLNGQESPTIETAEADFNVLGIQMRGYHDFGCALQDPRGGVRAKGEV